MATLTIDISDAPVGTHAKVKKQIKGTSWVYNKPSFTVDGLSNDEADALISKIEPLGAAVSASMDVSTLVADLVAEQPEEDEPTDEELPDIVPPAPAPAPAPEPAPEPEPEPEPAAVAPASDDGALAALFAAKSKFIRRK
jgi:hypothetical protein